MSEPTDGAAGSGASDFGSGHSGGSRRARLESAVRLTSTPTGMRGFVPSYARRPAGSRLPAVAALVLDLGVVFAQGGAARARHQLRAVLPSVLAVTPVQVELAGERMNTHLRMAGEPRAGAGAPRDARMRRDRPRPPPPGRRFGITFTRGPDPAPDSPPRHRRKVGPDTPDAPGAPAGGDAKGTLAPGGFAVGAGFAPANPLLSRERYAQLTAQRAVEFVCAFLDAELGPAGWVGFDSVVSTEVHGERIAVTLTRRSTGVRAELPDVPVDPFLRHLFIDPA